MFCSIRNMSDAVEKLEQAQNEDTFHEALAFIRGWMKEQGMDAEACLELDKRAFYFHNQYSDKDSKEKLKEAQKRVIAYLSEVMEKSMTDHIIIKILNNFYLFLENFYTMD